MIQYGHDFLNTLSLGGMVFFGALILLLAAGVATMLLTWASGYLIRANDEIQKVLDDAFTRPISYTDTANRTSLTVGRVVRLYLKVNRAWFQWEYDNLAELCTHALYMRLVTQMPPEPMVYLDETQNITGLYATGYRNEQTATGLVHYYDIHVAYYPNVDHNIDDLPISSTWGFQYIEGVREWLVCSIEDKAGHHGK